MAQSDLPSEIWYEILLYVPAQKDLAALAAVCRKLYVESHRFLYRSVNLSKWLTRYEEQVNLCHTISRPEVAVHVKCLWVRLNSLTPEVAASAWSIIQSTLCVLERLEYLDFDIADSLKPSITPLPVYDFTFRLKRLTLPATFGSEEILALFVSQPSIQYLDCASSLNIPNPLSPTILPNLRTLECAIRDSWNLTRNRPIEHLSLSRWSPSPTSSERMLYENLASSLPSLRSLRTADLMLDASMVAPLPKHFPSLELLSGVSASADAFYLELTASHLTKFRHLRACDLVHSMNQEDLPKAAQAIFARCPSIEILEFAAFGHPSMRWTRNEIFNSPILTKVRADSLWMERTDMEFYIPSKSFGRDDVDAHSP